MNVNESHVITDVFINSKLKTWFFNIPVYHYDFHPSLRIERGRYWRIKFEEEGTGVGVGLVRLYRILIGSFCPRVFHGDDNDYSRKTYRTSIQGCSFSILGDLMVISIPYTYVYWRCGPLSSVRTLSLVLYSTLMSFGPLLGTYPFSFLRNIYFSIKLTWNLLPILKFSLSTSLPRRPFFFNGFSSNSPIFFVV